MFGRINRNNASTLALIQRMAERAEWNVVYFHESGKTAEEWKKHNPFIVFSAQQFVVHLLHRVNKPLNENLILKGLRENQVSFEHKNVKRLLVEMHAWGVIKYYNKQGYNLTDEMKDEIRTFNPPQLR